MSKNALQQKNINFAISNLTPDQKSQLFDQVLMHMSECGDKLAGFASQLSSFNGRIEKMETAYSILEDDTKKNSDEISRLSSKQDLLFTAQEGLRSQIVEMRKTVDLIAEIITKFNNFLDVSSLIKNWLYFVLKMILVVCALYVAAHADAKSFLGILIGILK